MTLQTPNGETNPDKQQMSTFSKNYYSPKDSNKYLSVSWEKGYQNIQIYDQGRLVQTIQNPAVLMKGIVINDSDVGKIKIRFTTGRPRKLEIKVNNKKYKTVNKIDLGYDYTGLVTIFTFLSVFAFLGILILLGMTGFNVDHPIVKAVLVIDSIIVIAYGLTSYLLRKKKPMAYFVGTSIYLITTLYETFIESFLWSDTGSYLTLIFRYSLLIFILVQGRHILKEIKKEQASTSDNEILDKV